MADSTNTFDLLDINLKKWIYKKGWHDLLPIQKASIKPILDKKNDLIISASTASGKTEAAFLPALTAINADPKKKGIRILYISPLKALINDQFRRLEEITEDIKIKVTPWHGDISANRKHKLEQSPEGVILTTPESLESLLINRVGWLRESTQNLDYFIIDEFHAFMGTQRGYQLQSQLNRLDNLAGHRVVRIALSATFSDVNAVKSYLRPGSNVKCELITGSKDQKDTLSVQIRGYDLTPEEGELETIKNQTLPKEYDQVAKDIFRFLRGSTNLVFCNSRFLTEAISTELQKLSQKNFVPNEFFPHHGSLSKDLRESLEARLQEGRLPTTAICTATLELGIDISDVASIAQIEPPMSVASMRQRLGRAGRRDHIAVLRLFIPEYTQSTQLLKTQLCEDTFLSVAMINLLLQRWYEPPMEHEYAFSTLLQQTLSVIASFGSVSAKNLYELLCKYGPFSICTPEIFMKFLKDLGEKDLIVQLNDKSLTLGLEGEKLVSNWNFYASFKTPDEYTIENDNRKIGTVPLNQPISIDDTFLFAGRGWKVVYFSQERKIIGVKSYPHDAQPLVVNGTSGRIHDAIREEMFRLYTEGKIPPYLNKNARMHCILGIRNFNTNNLKTRHIIEGPKGYQIYPWKGDRVIRTIILMLKQESIKAIQWKSHIELGFTSMDTLKEAVKKILEKADTITATELVAKVKNIDIDKHDIYLSQELKQISYAYSALDLDGALSFFKLLAKELA
ncbi:MAG: DEAD/DEAH box helicase [Succinivibrio sp.]|nr:DEAD/DEAH box helicase [Succinivibrio sp.]